VDVVLCHKQFAGVAAKQGSSGGCQVLDAIGHAASFVPWVLGKRWWLRLHEKGGKVHEVPAHHMLEEYLDEWLTVGNLRADGKGKGPLFPAIRGRTGTLSDLPMTRNDALRAIKRRARAAGLSAGSVCCHTFRATGITTFLENGGSLETAQAIAAHESPRTTMLYDRTGEKIMTCSPDFGPPAMGVSATC
jgi:integrase